MSVRFLFPRGWVIGTVSTLKKVERGKGRGVEDVAGDGMAWHPVACHVGRDSHLAKRTRNQDLCRIDWPGVR